MIKSICICGAGTMGSGIAQVSAQSGFNTVLFDLDGATLEKSKVSILDNLKSQVQKQKIEEAEIQTSFSRLNFTTNINLCKSDIIIEAIAEKIEAKISLFNQLAEINGPSVIFASNTSSLRISEIQKNISMPKQLAGMHFFNPSQLMKLV